MDVLWEGGWGSERNVYGMSLDTKWICKSSLKVTRFGTLASPKTEGQLSICPQVNLFQWIIINLILFAR